jgi:hypothetical protein
MEAPDGGINAPQSLTERAWVGHKIHDRGDEAGENENGGTEAADLGINVAQHLAERARVRRR